MSRARILSGAVLLLASLLRPVMGAADDFRSLMVNATVPVIQQVRLSSGTVVMPTPTEGDFSAGYVQVDRAFVLRVSSNTGWELTVQTSSPNLGSARGITKPLSDFLWRRAGGEFSPISFTPAVVESRAGWSAARDVVLDCRMLLDWVRDQEGTYQVGLTFTLTSSH